jgi:hemoglobin/transferrin/lactoferrin receptor protein
LTPQFSNLVATVSYQEQSEEQRRIRADGRSDVQGFDVGTLGLSLQLQTPGEAGDWVYGFEHYADSVSSYRRDFDASGNLQRVRIQGPVADDARYRMTGLYGERHVQVRDGLELIAGARYTYAAAAANRVEDPVTGQLISLADHWSAMVGSLRFLATPASASGWRVFGGIAQGFRAPNLSDLTRFDTARSNEIETPVRQLDPERFISYELGLKGATQHWDGPAALFYTDIRDQIVRVRTGVVLEGDEQVSKANVGAGFIRGLEAEGRYRFNEAWSVFGTFTWLDGESTAEANPPAAALREPVSRLMPVTWVAGLRWRDSQAHWFEAAAVHARTQDQLSSSDQLDTQRIPPGGTPGYTVFNLRGGMRLGERTTLALALENLTDQDYRVHGSGLNEAGRNLVLTMDWLLR